VPSRPETTVTILWLAGIAARALAYAVAITALVLYAPSAQHVFIYQGF